LKTGIGVAAVIGYLLVILAANFATSHYGMAPVGFGLVATAGTYLAGISFVLRDSVQDTLGRWVVVAAIVAGCALSFALSAPAIAVASAAAFLLGEGIDLLIYTPLRKRGYVRAALASNIVGSFVDSIVFLAIAGFPIWSSLPGQMIGKLVITAIVVGLVGAGRAVFRNPVRA